MKDKSPAPHPGDDRPGASAMITVSAADLADLVGDLTASAVVAQAALLTVAKALETMRDDCEREGDNAPTLAQLANGLNSARTILDTPGMLTARTGSGLRDLEAAICAGASKIEGKKMPPPGLALLNQIKPGEEGIDGEELRNQVEKILGERAFALALAFSPRAEPPPFTGRNGLGGEWKQNGGRDN